jgi:hypothetical protein
MKKYLQFINEAKFIPPPNKRAYPIIPKIGDYVKCIDDGFHSQLNTGERYIITNIKPGCFRLTNSHGKNIDYWDFQRFELDTDESKLLRKKCDNLIKELGLKKGVIIKFKEYWPSGKCDISVGEIFSKKINNIDELYVKSIEKEWNNYIDLYFIKKSLIKKWDNWDEYYKEKRNISELDPFGEEDWVDDLNETTIIDYIGDDIDQKDVVWCEINKLTTYKI